MDDFQVRIIALKGGMTKTVTVQATGAEDAKLTVAGMYPGYKQISYPQRVARPRPVSRQAVHHDPQPQRSAPQSGQGGYSIPRVSSSGSGGSPTGNVLVLGFIVVSVAISGIVTSFQKADRHLCNPECQVSRQQFMKNLGINFPVNREPKSEPADADVEIDTGKAIMEQHARMFEEQRRQRLERDLREQTNKAQKEEPPVLPAVPEPPAQQVEPQESRWTHPDLSPEHRAVVDSLPDGPNDTRPQ